MICAIQWPWKVFRGRVDFNITVSLWFDGKGQVRRIHRGLIAWPSRCSVTYVICGFWRVSRDCVGFSIDVLLSIDRKPFGRVSWSTVACPSRRRVSRDEREADGILSSILRAGELQEICRRFAGSWRRRTKGGAVASWLYELQPLGKERKTWLGFEVVCSLLGWDTRWRPTRPPRYSRQALSIAKFPDCAGLYFSSALGHLPGSLANCDISLSKQSLISVKTTMREITSLSICLIILRCCP